MPRLYHLNQYTSLRKSLRNHATNAERLLWRYLRQRQFHGFKFRRQEGIGRYIVDFYCPAKRLAIEIDGDNHDAPEQKDYDHERTRFLRSCYIRVVRFRNNEVMRNIRGVLRKLERILLTPTPKPPP